MDSCCARRASADRDAVLCSFPQIYTMSRDLTAKWLRQQTPAYRDADRVYVDVLNALDSCSSLRPKTDVYSTDLSQLCIYLLLSVVNG